MELSEICHEIEEDCVSVWHYLETEIDDMIESSETAALDIMSAVEDVAKFFETADVMGAY